MGDGPFDRRLSRKHIFDSIDASLRRLETDYEKKHMDNVVSGGCLCGFIRYEYDGELGAANYCHCNDCRRTTGSAFNIGIRAYASILVLSLVKSRVTQKQGVVAMQSLVSFVQNAARPCLLEHQLSQSLFGSKLEVLTIQS